MWKQLLVIIGAAISLSACNLAPKRAAIEILSNPSSKVFLNGKEVGSTPYKNTSLKPEEVELRLESGSIKWAKTIKLRNHTNTVVNWEFDEKNGESGGYVLAMEKTGDNKRAGLIVNSIPDKAAISVLNEQKGLTPSKIENIGEEDKPVSVSFPAYRSQNIFIKPVSGYQIIIDAVLLKETVINEEMDKVAEGEPLDSLVDREEMIMIKPTETGWLRVRQAADSGSAEIGRVKPGEEYKLVSETAEWFQIEIDKNKLGWISAKYGVKTSE